MMQVLETKCPPRMGTEPDDRWTMDPFEIDDIDDAGIDMTRRSLLRLIVSAADAGARFARTREEVDPVQWMLTPSPLFHGRPAIEACAELEAFSLSLIVHGLGMDPGSSRSDVEHLAGCGRREAADRGGADSTAQDAAPARAPRLMTAWVDISTARGRLLAFVALVARDREQLTRRIVQRLGADAAMNAVCSDGFDALHPLVGRLLSDATIDALALASCEPLGASPRDVDLVVEQRLPW